MPDTVLIRKKKSSNSVPSKQTLFATNGKEQESRDEQVVHSTETWMWRLVPGDLIHECHEG